jgi:hypothetical protein
MTLGKAAVSPLNPRDRMRSGGVVEMRALYVLAETLKNDA